MQADHNAAAAAASLTIAASGNFWANQLRASKDPNEARTLFPSSGYATTASLGTFVYFLL
jgi:hypothetical protein